MKGLAKKLTQIRPQVKNHIPSGLELSSIPMVLLLKKDSSAVKKKHWNTYSTKLTSLNHMRQALVSFIHSIGWEPFFYSSIVDCLENEDFAGATEEIGRWIFNAEHKVIGGLLDRRREEIDLFLQEVDANPWSSTEILLTAFRNYSAAPHEVRAIRLLEEQINPYILSQFANNFKIDENPWLDFADASLDSLFNVYD
jgi:hypothetical protein